MLKSTPTLCIWRLQKGKRQNFEVWFGLDFLAVVNSLDL